VANLLEHLRRACASYDVSVELIDLPIGQDGYIVIVSSSRDLTTKEMKELERVLTGASTQVKRIMIDITPKK